MANSWENTAGGGAHASIAELILRFRLWLSAGLLIFATVAASGMQYLEFDGNYRAFFSPENPELIAFDAFQRTYTRNDNVFFILHDAEATGFSRQLAEASEQLTEMSWQLPFATRVDSISNFQHSYAQDDDLLIVEDLLQNVTAMSDAEIQRRGAIALAEPLLVENMISLDGRSVAVSVTMPFPEKSPTEIPTAVAAARAAADEIRAAFPGLRVALSGTTMFNNAFNEAGQMDSETLIPLSYIVMIVLSMILLRSFSGGIATLIVIALATVTALGLAGYAGIKLAPITIAAPTIILTLAVADSVHLIASIKRELMRGEPKRIAIRNSLRSNGLAIFLTSVTTAIGFLSMNFSDSPPFRALGTITAMGVMAAWVYAIVLVPTVLMLMPLRVSKTEKTGLVERLLGSYAGFVIGRRRSILLVGGVVSAGFLGLATLNENNDRFPEYFDYRMPFRSDLEFGIRVLKSADIFEVSFSSGRSNGISEPEYLRELDAFTQWLREQPDVRHVYSYSDLIQRLNMNLHGDDPSWRVLPGASDLAAQYLLLYELSLPYGLDLNDRISVDRSATRVSIALRDVTAKDARALSAAVIKWIDDNPSSLVVPARPTGPSVMFSFISKRNVDAMVSGTVLAVLLVAVAIMVGLRSFTFGLLSLIPNILPVVIAFGIWALFVGKIGMAASVIGATSLGIVVDDTIHFVAKYLQARRERAMSPEEAIRHAFTTVGPAIIATTIIVAAGFLVLATSVFAVNSQLGQLTAITISVALVFDFTVLPALLLAVAREPGRVPLSQPVAP
ncbi:MAG: RND transporter [Rhodobiaceae bacterium]|nr:MAG: RND transporter [Rhodobiaceae bacterium]